MASSGDELDSYQQSSRADLETSGASKPARQVAGPSKPALKRKKGTSSSIVGNADTRHNVVDSIAISSDEEDARSTNGRRVRTATGATAPPAPNGRAVSSRGKGKAINASSRRNVGTEADVVDVTEETVVETEDGGPSRREKVRSVAGSSKGKNHDQAHQLLERLQKQLEDVSNQRDSMAKQLEELLQLRYTEPEQHLAEQKTQFEARLKAQEDTIQELQSSLTRVDTLAQSGGTTSLHFLTRETADKEKQDVQREVGKLKDIIKKKDQVIGEKDADVLTLNETIKVLRADLRAEIENTKTLASRNPPSSASKHTSKSGEAKNALAIRLYEELTNLLITNVRHEPGQYKEDDAIYTCVQTTSKGTSLNFTLKFFKDAAEGETPSSAKRNGRTIDKVVYTPLLLEKESEEFIAQLDFLAAPFTFQKEQMAVFTTTLNLHLEKSGEDDQSNASQMEDD